MSREATSSFAAIHYPRGFDIDRLLGEVCEELSRSSIRLGGLVQLITGKRGGSCATSVQLFDLRTKQSFNIWEDRGTCAVGCRLDEGVLADAESVLQAAIEDRVDLLIINRFGRAESLGRGLRTSFAAAALADIPVLTAVRAPYDVAWRECHENTGFDLSCDLPSVVRWARSVARRSAAGPRSGQSAEEVRLLS